MARVGGGREGEAAKGLTCNPGTDSEGAHNLKTSEILPENKVSLRAILLKARKDFICSIAGPFVLQMAQGGKE